MDVCRMLEKGLIQVYTSQSDRMNFAPIGLSLRAAGHGFRTLITNFTFDEMLEGLSFASQFLQPNLRIENYAPEQIPTPGGETNSTNLEREGFKNKREGKKALLEDVSDLADAQSLLWANAKHSVLIILQALDAGGKDGAIKHVMSGVNPQGVDVHAFKAPTEEERLHHFLWTANYRINI